MKFLFLYRKSVDPRDQPSPADMQAGYMQWKSWMAKHSKEILEQPDATVVVDPGLVARVDRLGNLLIERAS